MKYTDSKNNITFNNVKSAGVYHASGPIGLNGLYTTSGSNITNINSDLSLINAIDINWNGALVEPGIELNTTGDLLRWIKEHSGGSQGTIELTINNQGYWCINGVSTGVKAQGEDGLTPFIGSNGNWWIGNTDTGVAANAKTIVENNISYTSDITNSTAGNYRLGTLTVGNNNYPILGKDLNSSENVFVSYLDSVGTTAAGHYTIGTLQIGNSIITINGIDTKGEGGSGEGGTTYIENPYDDSQIKQSISDLNNILTNLHNTVDNIRNWSESEINNLINQGLNDWDFGKNITPDEIFNLNGWNEKLKLFILLIAFKDSENNDLTISQIILRLESIESVVDNIKIVDEDGNAITLEQLISRVKVAVEEDINGYLSSVAALEAAFNRFKSNDGDFGTLKSNFASFLALANDKIAELTAAVDSKATKDYVDQETGKVRTAIGEATAGFYTKSEVDGKISTATAQMISESTMRLYVDGKETELRDAISGLYTKTEVDNKISQATTNLVTEATMEDYVTGEINTAKSGLATKAYVDDEITSASASLLASSELLDKINNTVESATSGFVASTDVYTKPQTDGLIASARSDMMSEIDGKYAKVSTVVTKDSDGKIESGVTIDADKVIIGEKDLSGSAASYLEGRTLDKYMELVNASFLNDVLSPWDDALAPSNALLALYNDAVVANAILCSKVCSIENGHFGEAEQIHLTSDGISFNLDSYNDLNTKIIWGPAKRDVYVSGKDEVVVYKGDNGTTIGPLDIYTPELNIGDSKIDYYNNRLRIQSGVNIENNLILNKSLKLYNNLNEEQASIELDNDGDLSFINKSGNNSMGVSFNTFETLYASTIECDEVVDGTSDERIKENIVPVETNISDIANARIVNFNFIGENKTKFGSIALDWQNIFPEAVKENSKGNLTMNYGAIALGSAVTAAREIVALKEENRQLKDRLAAIEQKLEAINTALG